MRSHAICHLMVYEPQSLRFLRVFPEKVEPEFFRFGSGIFYFPRQSENFLEPRFSERSVGKFSCQNHRIAISHILSDFLMGARADKIG